MPDVCLSLGGYVSYTSMRKRVDPSVRTRMCVCVRWCISWEPFETVRARSDELMGDRERKREKREEEVSVCVRGSQRERESCCYTSWHRPDPIQTPTQGMLAVLFFLVLCGKILWPATLLLLLLKLTTWTLSHIRWDQLRLSHAFTPTRPFLSIFGSKIMQSLLYLSIKSRHSQKDLQWTPEIKGLERQPPMKHHPYIYDRSIKMI